MKTLVMKLSVYEGDFDNKPSCVALLFALINYGIKYSRKDHTSIYFRFTLRLIYQFSYRPFLKI